MRPTVCRSAAAGNRYSPALANVPGLVHGAPPHVSGRQPRPAKGIFVAMTVWNMTLASSGRFAM